MSAKKHYKVEHLQCGNKEFRVYLTVAHIVLDFLFFSYPADLSVAGQP